MCDPMNSFHFVVRLAGCCAAFDPGSHDPDWSSAPMIRSYPQLRFSPANWTTSVSASGDILGRPGQVRRREPSNLCAHQLPVPGEQGIRLGHACKSDVLHLRYVEQTECLMFC
jgi:hypothetical protein